MFRKNSVGIVDESRQRCFGVLLYILSFFYITDIGGYIKATAYVNITMNFLALKLKSAADYVFVYYKNI